MAVKSKTKPAVNAQPRARGRALRVPTARAATRRQFLTIAGATVGATTLLARTEAQPTEALRMAGTRGKQEIQTALRCIAVWTDAIRQVLAHEPRDRRIGSTEIVIGPIGPSGGDCGRNIRSGCWPTNAKSLSIEDILKALARIERFARAVEDGIEPIPSAPLNDFKAGPDLVDIVERPRRPGVPQR